ncbi:hypothetical protein BKA82DRAFT_4015913 [Pisolithus tinctorius]|nr:hypothetical protein BKA82DRAFT_4015913 [Pisolithus tinctorius]
MAFPDHGLQTFEYPAHTLITTATSHTEVDTYVKIWKSKSNSTLSVVSKSVRLYFWTWNLAFKSALHSLMIKKVPLVPIVIIAVATFLICCVQGSLLDMLSPSLETLLKCLYTEDYHLKKLKSRITTTVCQVALNIIRCLHKRLQDADKVSPMSKDLVISAQDIIYL